MAQIETFIRQKPAVLIVAPNERDALTAVMGKAMEAGIPDRVLELGGSDFLALAMNPYCTWVADNDVLVARFDQVILSVVNIR